MNIAAKPARWPIASSEKRKDLGSWRLLKGGARVNLAVKGAARLLKGEEGTKKKMDETRE